MKLNQNINEEWRKSTKTAIIVVMNILFPYVNKSHYPYFLIRCWLQLLAPMSGLFSIRSMRIPHKLKSHGVMSGNCGGHSTVPHLPVHLEKWLFKSEHTSRPKWHRVPSCCRTNSQLAKHGSKLRTVQSSPLSSTYFTAFAVPSKEYSPSIL